MAKQSVKKVKGKKDTYKVTTPKPGNALGVVRLYNAVTGNKVSKTVKVDGYTGATKKKAAPKKTAAKKKTTKKK